MDWVKLRQDGDQWKTFKLCNEVFDSIEGGKFS